MNDVVSMAIARSADSSRALRGAALTAALLSIVAWVCLTATPASALTEREVKAAFTFNFAKFVEFPSNTFSKADDPIVVGVFEAPQIADILEKLVKGKTANGRRLEIKQFTKVSQCSSCQILFVGSSGNGRVSEVLEKVKNTGVLTVGESDGFARRGGVIGFIVDNNKIGFEISTTAAKREALKISSKLLSLARIAG